MAQDPPAFRLSKLNGGVNTFEQQAGPDQCVEAIDVIEDNGYVRRRDAFKAIGTGAPFLLPAGRTVVVRYDASGPTYYNDYDRVFSAYSVSKIGGTNGHLYIGCDIPFDGIDWGHVSLSSTIIVHTAHLTPKYWDGSQWASVNVVDTTSLATADAIGGPSTINTTLLQDGRISWHRDHVSDWATTTVNSITKYWMRLDIEEGYINASITLTMLEPGPRVFLLEPVRAIFPIKFSSGLQTTLVCSDRSPPRGAELGAQVGSWQGEGRPTDILHYVDDEGSGVFGGYTYPDTYQNDDASLDEDDWPDGTNWSSVVTNSNTFGNAGGLSLYKADHSYEWLYDSTNHIYDQHKGSIIRPNFTGTTGSQSGTTLQGSWGVVGGLSFNNVSYPANFFEHCRLRVDPNTGSGPSAGEEKEITSNSTTLVAYHGPFSSSPTSGTIFNILLPNARLYCRESARKEGFEILQNTQHYATIIADTEYFKTDVDLSDQNIHWEIGQELQWRVRAGKFWTATYNPLDRKLYLTNGKSGLLAFDGRSIRQAVNNTDPDSIAVKEWISALATATSQDLEAASLVQTQLRNYPPSGQFVVEYLNRIVVADGYKVYYSAPGDTDIWPNTYVAEMRDAENLAITGMATLNDQLIVYTPSTIFASDPPQSGYMNFRAVAQGVGYMSHRAVQKIALSGSSVLIGPASDGVYLFNGSEPAAVLDDWRRVIKEGINTRLLTNAVAGVWKSRNEYYLAVASANSEVNDRLLVFNYVTNKWWVWTIPWGGFTAIAKEYDDFGQERLLFGTNDGHVAVLVKALTDDGDAITGTVRSPKVMPLGTNTVAPTALMITAKETGPIETLVVRSYLDGKEYSHQAFEGTFDAGAHAFDETDQKYGNVTGSNVQAVFAPEASVTRRINMVRGTRCESFEFEIEGTGRWQFESAELLVVPKGYRAK